MSQYAAALESAEVLFQKLDKLYALKEKIDQSNGMSKQFALEALDVLPNFNGNKSMAVYSETPGYSQHRVALEEVHAGIVALIVAGIAALVLMIKKAIDWFGGSSGGGGGGAGGGSSNSAKVHTLAENLQKENKAFMQHLAKLDHDAVKIVNTSISKVFDELEYDMGNEAFFCLVNHGAFMEKLDRIYERVIKDEKGGNFLQGDDESVDSIVEKMVQGMKEHRAHQSGPMESDAEIDADIAKDKQKFREKIDNELTEWNTGYADLEKKYTQKLSSMTVDEIVRNCDKAMDAVKRMEYNEDDFKKFVEKMKKEEKKLEELSKAVEQKKDLTPQEIKALKAMMDMLKTGITGAFSALAIYEKFFGSVLRTTRKINKAIRDGKHDVKEQMKSNPQQFTEKKDYQEFKEFLLSKEVLQF